MSKTIFYLMASLLVASNGECARKKGPDPRDQPPPPRFATLRPSRPSYLMSGRAGHREVRYLSVKVSNVGDGDAKDVQVLIEGASGLAFPLRGPKRLAPHAHGIYVSTVRVPSGVALQPHAIVTCSTCRQ